MPYSKEGIRELHLDVDRILMDGGKYNDKVTSIEDLQNRLRRKAKLKEIDFQSKCEGGNLLGDLLLKHATENNNPRVKDFLLQNGCKPLQQEQITAAINKEKEAPNVEENRADSNEVNPGNSKAAQFSTSYDKIKEIVTKNPDITAGKFNEELKKEKIDTKITNQDGWTLLYYAVRSEGPSITGDRSIFLKTVELLTNSGIKVNDIQDTAYTLLDRAAITKQADVVRIPLDSGKFNEEEKFNALRSAITQDNAQEAELILGYVSPANRKEALEVAIQVGKTEIVNAFLNSGKLNEENRAEPSSSNGNIGSRPIATVPLTSTNGDNRNHDNEIPVVTVPPILTKKTNPTTVPNSGNGRSVSNKPVSPVVSTNAGTPAMSSGNDKSSNFTNSQFSMPNEQETKYKESKKDFYTSLTKDVVGVIITGLFITAAVMVPFVAGAVICSVIAALIAIYTGLHVKNSTLPSYREMEKNKVEHVSSYMQKV